MNSVLGKRVELLSLMLSPVVSALSCRRFKLELSSEYLINRSAIKSTSIQSNESVFLSTCLQGMFNKLLSKRNEFSSSSSPVSPFISSSSCSNTFLPMSELKQIISGSIFTWNLSASQCTRAACISLIQQFIWITCPCLCDATSARSDGVNSPPFD